MKVRKKVTGSIYKKLILETFNSYFFGEVKPAQPNSLSGPFPRIVRIDPIKINSCRKEVWDVLSDFESYSTWCPFTRKIEKGLKLGDDVKLHLNWTMKLDDPKQVQTEKLSIWEEEKVMAWALKWPGLNAERIQYLEETEPGLCIYHCFDRFSGILSPIVMGFYREKMKLGFESVGKALKQRVESN